MLRGENAPGNQLNTGVGVKIKGKWWEKKTKVRLKLVDKNGGWDKRERRKANKRVYILSYNRGKKTKLRKE